MPLSDRSWNIVANMVNGELRILHVLLVPVATILTGCQPFSVAMQPHPPESSGTVGDLESDSDSSQQELADVPSTEQQFVTSPSYSPINPVVVVTPPAGHWYLKGPRDASINRYYGPARHPEVIAVPPRWPVRPGPLVVRRPVRSGPPLVRPVHYGPPPRT
jgi:hypothetical protein